jgi:hypothetical protein
MVTLLINIQSCPKAPDLILKLGQVCYDERELDSTCEMVNFLRTRKDALEGGGGGLAGRVRKCPGDVGREN